MKNLAELIKPLVGNIEDYAIVVLDEKGRIKEWNKGAEIIRGYSAQEILNKNYRLLFCEEERKKLLPENLLKEAKKNGKAIYEGWKLKKDGTVFWAHVVFTAVYNEEKKLIGFTKIIKDLTENRKQVDFQHNNLDALINNLQGLMWSVDRNCNLITSNKAFDELAKLYFGKIIVPGDHILSLSLIPDQLIRLTEYYKRAFKGETFSVIEYLPLPAGAWFEISFNPILNNNGIAGTACYAHDISEIKKVQDQLLSNEHKFRRLIENSTDGVIIFSETMELQYISPSVISILGYTDNELKQIDLFTLFHPNDITPSQKIIENALSNPGQPIKGHLGQIRHKDGTWRWIDSVVTNLLNDPAVNGIVDNFWDVTEKVKVEQKLKRVNHLYSFINEVGRVMIRNSSQENLFKTVCHLAVGFGKISLAWIGLIDTEHKKINLVTQYGMYTCDIPLFQDIPYENNGPQDFVVLHGDYYVCNDVENAPGLEKWKDIARLRNWRSIITLPIKKEGHIFATLNLYTSELDFFDKEEIILVKEAVHELSLALDIFEKEKHRRELEDKLKANLLRLERAQEIANFGAYEVDFSKQGAIWSEQFCKIYGVSPHDNQHSLENWLSFVHPKDYERVKELIKKTNEQHLNVNFYYRIIRRDGSTRTIHSYRHMEFDENGKATGVYVVAHDITDAMSNIMHLKDQNKKLREIAWIQSHKVRSPLATILGLAQLFQYEQSPDQLEQIIKGIVESTEKLDEVIHEITDKTSDSEINQIYFPDID